MIKQQDISNFVSLINRLKEQSSTYKTNTQALLKNQNKQANFMENPRNISTLRRENTPKIVSFIKKQNKSSERKVYSPQNDALAKTFYQKDKKFLKHYCEVMERWIIAKPHVHSLQKFPQFICNSMTNSKYNRLAHKRSSTNVGGINASKQEIKPQPEKIQDKRALYIKTMHKNIRGKKGKQNRIPEAFKLLCVLRENQQPEKHRSLYCGQKQQKKILAAPEIGENNQRKRELLASEPPKQSSQSSSNDIWVMGGWEQKSQRQMMEYQPSN